MHGKMTTLVSGKEWMGGSWEMTGRQTIQEAIAGIWVRGDESLDH